MEHPFFADSGRRPAPRRTPALLAAGLLALTAVTAPASAQTLYGLTTITGTSMFIPLPPVGSQVIGTINPTNGAANLAGAIPITGVTAGQTLVGIDARPATGELWALGYDASLTTNNTRLYTLNPATGVATAVGPGALSLDLGTDPNRIGFDFNPTVDRIRVVSQNDKSFRLNPNTGGLVTQDGNLAYPGNVPTANPQVGTAFYTNSTIGATATTFYVLDETAGSGRLVTVNPPNVGTLASFVPLTLDTGTGPFPIGSGVKLDADTYLDPITKQTTVRLVEVTGVANNFASNLYTLPLTGPNAGQAVRLGNILFGGSPAEVRDIAFAIDRTAPAPSGQLTYAISSTSTLLSFNSGNPEFILAATPITGLTAGETLAGLDARPATGQLYALGYNATAQTGTIYTLNAGTAALTAVNATPVAMPLGTGTDRIGFDFNPTVDRIRIVATNGANLRLNPADATFITDTNLAAGPSIGAAAYTNNQSNANTTQLFDFDATTGTLYLQNPPNAGALVAVGAGLNNSGLGAAAAADGADFDIFNTPATTTNLALLALNTDATAGRTAFDRLYTVNLATGAATLVNSIGLATNVTGLAVGISAGTLLTWTGASSTAWGLAGNWSPAQIPAANNDVLIPGAPINQPTVSDAQQARNITLGSGAILNLASGGTLTGGGSFTSNGATVTGAGTGTLMLAGTGAQTIGGTGTLTFPNLTVSSGGTGATAALDVRVVRLLTLNANLSIGGTGALTLLSSAAGGQGQVINNGTAAVSGAATVQVRINPSFNAGLGYRHVSSPVVATTVEDLATTGYTPKVNSAYNAIPTPALTAAQFPNIFGYDETRGGAALTAFSLGYFSPNTLNDPLVQGRGYSAYMTGGVVPDFVGILGNGTVGPLTLTRTGVGTGNPNNDKTGWHLLGNPYPAPLDWDLIPASEFQPGGAYQGLSGSISVFRSTGANSGQYLLRANNAGSLPNGEVAVGQGFFTRVVSGESASFSFLNAYRVSAYANTPHYRAAADPRPLLTLGLRAATASAVTDELTVYFQDGATAALDAPFDAPRPGHNLGNVPTLSALTTDGAEVAVDGRPLTALAGTTVELALALPTAGAHQLTAARLANLAGTPVALLDRLTGTTYDLTTTPTVRFTAARAGDVTGRFALVFGQRVLGVGTATTSVAVLQLTPNPARAAVRVAGLPTGATILTLVDATGRTVLRRPAPASASETTLDLTGVAPGVYTLRAGALTQRLVVE